MSNYEVMTIEPNKEDRGFLSGFWLALVVFVTLIGLFGEWAGVRETPMAGSLTIVIAIFYTIFTTACVYGCIKRGLSWLEQNWGTALWMFIGWLVLALWNPYFILILTLGSLAIFSIMRTRVVEAERVKAKLEAERIAAFEAEQRAKGREKFVSKEGLVRWGTPEEVRLWKGIDIGLHNNFAQLTPKQFEAFIGLLFQKMGYQVEDLPYVGDYGADLIASRGDERICGQVKHWSYGNTAG